MNTSTRKDSRRRQARVLAVDDDPGLLRLLTIRLRSEQYLVEPVHSAAEALAALDRFRPDLVVTDLRMAQMDGIALLEELQIRRPGLKVILITAHGTIPDAVRATQSGAFGFLTKPIEKEQLLAEVRKALRVSGIPTVDETWREGFITRSPLVEQRLTQARSAAANDVGVLISGEPGSGKKALARAIHSASARAEGPFVVVGCVELAGDNLAADLFGDGEIETAARGLVHAARGGTLVLDEVGDLPVGVQSRLARMLADGGLLRLPSPSGERSEDARLIATTRADLQKRVEQGLFREDLYYRLQTVHIDVPPLARRREDIPLLVAHFLEQIAQASNVRQTYAPGAIEMLATAEWPGNVRQLQAIVRQTAAASPSTIIPVEIAERAVGASTLGLPSFDDARDEFTRNYLVQILQITGGNVSQAARLAKRNRTDFYKLLNRHQLSPDDFKTRDSDE